MVALLLESFSSEIYVNFSKHILPELLGLSPRLPQCLQQFVLCYRRKRFSVVGAFDVSIKSALERALRMLQLRCPRLYPFFVTSFWKYSTDIHLYSRNSSIWTAEKGQQIQCSQKKFTCLDLESPKSLTCRKNTSIEGTLDVKQLLLVLDSPRTSVFVAGLSRFRSSEELEERSDWTISALSLATTFPSQSTVTEPSSWGC